MSPKSVCMYESFYTGMECSCGPILTHSQFLILFPHLSTLIQIYFELIARHLFRYCYRKPNGWPQRVTTPCTQWSMSLPNIMMSCTPFSWRISMVNSSGVSSKVSGCGLSWCHALLPLRLTIPCCGLCRQWAAGQIWHKLLGEPSHFLWYEVLSTSVGWDNSVHTRHLRKYHSIQVNPRAMHRIACETIVALISMFPNFQFVNMETWLRRNHAAVCSWRREQRGPCLY